MKTSTLRPGLLVSLKTSVRGNVQYKKLDIETDHDIEGGARKAKWETERVIADAAEHDASIKARSKARSLVTSVCTDSAFGLLCPENASADLTKAIAEARVVIDAFNETATLARISFYVIVGRIASDEVEAVKAINSEVRDLLEDMKLGISNFDVAAIRKAAGKAKQLGSMLSVDAAAKVQIAVEAARSAARKMTAAGDEVAKELDARAIALVTEARTSFLDLDDAKEIAAPVVTAASLDLAPATKSFGSFAAATAAALELGER